MDYSSPGTILGIVVPPSRHLNQVSRGVSNSGIVDSHQPVTSAQVCYLIKRDVQLRPPSIASKSITMDKATTRTSGISRSKPKPLAANARPSPNKPRSGATVPGTTPKPKPIQIEHAELGKMAALATVARTRLLIQVFF